MADIGDVGHPLPTDRNFDPRGADWVATEPTRHRVREIPLDGLQMMPGSPRRKPLTWRGEQTSVLTKGGRFRPLPTAAAILVHDKPFGDSVILALI
jgi:hypothetical protein